MNTKLKQLRRQTEGFTIIEVIIVLAIAALILVIVFLAVPSLQRNSRNNQYRHDAGAIVAGAQEAINNKGGQALVAGDNLTVLGNANTAKIKTLTIQATTPASVTLVSAVIAVGYACPSPMPAAGASPLSVALTANASRSALVYATETSSTTITPQCTEF